ncbi:MAG: PepSY domain-containing protein [Alphaproteobacteria bacterium]
MRKLVIVLAFAAQIAVAPLVWAGNDHDRARRAYQAGQIVGLNQILRRVQSAYHGKVLEIELHERRGSNRGSPWVYTVRVLTPQGHVVNLRIDAKTTRILDVRGNGPEAAKKHKGKTKKRD